MAEASTSSDILWSIIAAIDFGTSNSGYAYAYAEDRTIHVNQWQVVEDDTKSTSKTPTTVLLNPEGGFDSFGYQAEHKYAKLCDQKQQDRWYYFRKFKLLLYNTKNLDTGTTIKEEGGKKMPAIDVFAIAIGYLKDHLQDSLVKAKQNADKSYLDENILWVLTVPAIWSDTAKQFMRKAAIQAGMQNQHLRLVLEPEAASVYCRHASLHIPEEQGPGLSFGHLPVGFRYIVVDLGGGTVDIATHEVTKDDRVYELCSAVGNDLGGIKFNNNFLEFLSDIFGEKLNEWKKRARKQFLLMERKIEGLKFAMSSTNDDVDFTLPLSLYQSVLDGQWKSLNEFLSNTKYKAMASEAEDNQLQLSNTFVKDFFKNTIEGVIFELNNIMKETPRIQSIVMVGGLAKSTYIYESIQAAFTRHKVIVPEDAGLSVLKGAVLLGSNPQIIAGRIARFTYGINVSKDFVEGKHRDEYKFTRDGEVLCNNVFQNIIEKGEVLKYGQKFTTATVVRAKQEQTKKKTFRTPLYQSTEKSPSYTTDHGCTYLGEIRKEPPEGGWPDYTESSVKIVVGEAEFKFFVKEDTGREYETKVDFLLPRKL